MPAFQVFRRLYLVQVKDADFFQVERLQALLNSRFHFAMRAGVALAGDDYFASIDALQSQGKVVVSAVALGCIVEIHSHLKRLPYGCCPLFWAYISLQWTQN